MKIKFIKSGLGLSPLGLDSLIQVRGLRTFKPHRWNLTVLWSPVVPSEQTEASTLTVQDDVLVRGTDVGVEVQTVSFVQLAGQTPSREQTHRFNAEETKCNVK